MMRSIVLGAAALLCLAGEVAVAQSETVDSEAQKAPQLTKAPELTRFVEATYPEAAKSEKKEGSVVLALTVSVDGTAKDVEVVTPAGSGFDEAALEAVKQFIFSPAEVDGEPAPVRIQYKYDFTLVAEVVEPPPQPKDALPMGRLTGRLIVRGFRKPLVGVQVELSDGQTAFSDGEGRFLFESVAAGEIVVKVSDDDYEDFETAETILEGQETDVTYYVERDTFDDAVVVVGKRIKKDVVRRTVQIAEIRLIPGTNGDALGVIQNLPGAARTPLGRTDLILRGGGRTQAYLNGQAIPLPFHFGGLRSTVSSALIEDIEIYPSNFGVQYGRVNGGIVDIKLRRPRRDAIHGFVEADVFDAGAIVEGPAGEHGALAVAVRRSYIDGVLALALPDDAPVTLSTAPRYYDAQILYDYQRGPHRLKLLAYGSSDRFIALISEAAANNPSARGEGRLALEWAGGQADWRYNFSDNAYNRFNLSYLATSTEVSFGRSVDLDFFFHQVLLRDEFEWKQSDAFTLRTGVDSEFLFSNIDAYGSGGPPKEGEPQRSGGFQDPVGVTSETFLVSPAVWLESLVKVGPVLLVPGLRLDYFGTTSEWVLQPRFTTRWNVTDVTVLKAGIGSYQQQPDGDEYSEAVGNPDIKSEEGWHASVGAEHQFSKEIDLELSVFYKDFDQLIRRVSDPAIQLDNQGIGRAYGIELLLRHNLTSRFFGWIGYTLQRSERRDSPEDEWRLFDSDQTHNLVVIGQYKLTPKWTLGLRWRYVTGNPTTPVVGSVYDADADRFAPVYGDVNSGRNDDFHQLDLRVDRQWVFDTWRLTAYLDVRNVYNRANGAGRSYNFDFSQSEPRTEIPVVPSFGIRGEF